MKHWLLLTPNEDGDPCTFLDADELRELLADPSSHGVTQWLHEVPDETDHNYWPEGTALLLRIEVRKPAEFPTNDLRGTS